MFDDFDKNLDTKDPDPSARIRLAYVRLALASAASRMLLKAYDALLHYGVNFRDTQAYKDQTLLDEGRRLPLLRGQESLTEWMRQIERDIAAAVKRKSFELRRGGRSGWDPQGIDPDDKGPKT